MASEKILVTGGAGYVGSHACKAVAEAGYEPVVYDNLSRGRKSFVQWGPFEKGHLEDAQTLRTVIAKHKPFAVMHFAAYALVGESVDDPLMYYRNNTVGTATLLSEVCAAEIDKFVFSSTCAVYGIPDVTPITEKAPLSPINPYGRTKLMSEQMLADAGEAHGLSWVALRYFNAAGADPEGTIGEMHEPETHLIPNVLKVAAGETAAVPMHGDDYPTPDGTCIRDYVHVADLADAHVKALIYLHGNPGGSIFNLGTGTGYSVRTVIETARQVTGHEIPVKIGPRRSGDPAILVADAAKVRQTLAWTPKRSSLEQQIADAWSWHRKHGFG